MVLWSHGPRGARRGFTLTELLIVIAIIAVLAALATGAAVRALNNAKRARILLEIRTMSQALEDLRNVVGAFPPNVYPGANTTLGMTTEEQAKNLADLRTFLGKVSTRSTERYNIGTIANYGLSPAEAAVFWLQGLSSDEKRPLSGSDLVIADIEDEDGTLIEDVVTIDSFKPRYDFDRGRLRISRDENGDPRMLEFRRVDNDPNTTFYVLLYEYTAAGSEKPLIYFDVSRSTPYQAVSKYPQTGEFFFTDVAEQASKVYPLKQLKPNAPKNSGTLTLRQHVEYVGQKKFQLMHPGMDDIWGNFSLAAIDVDDPQKIPDLLYPSGPFTGDIADTLTSFVDGPLADAEETE
jgi:prepilin-type N-terminal cleavage/methylation domain-containing protein